jgi:Do/DeqQ family serine protease
MNQNWKSLALVGIVSSAVTIGGVKLMGGFDNNRDVVFSEVGNGNPLAKFTSDPTGTPSVNAPVTGDFTYAAEISTPAVVHIKSVSTRQQSSGGMDIFDLFGEDFGMKRGGGGSQKQESSGSGVIMSSDGYIVTNNHVVEGAEELEVVMSDKRTFKAKIIGTDPSTDIAVIQIPAKDLPSLAFGNSDAIKVGEWVVAVGNPFNLESTVTAGIVSAKGRGLGIIGQQKQERFGFGQQQQRGTTPKEDFPLEAFIQTDAVVNPGNSGGALVNLRGELIGINTAIASPTGSFAGYAFAVPSALVKKVSSDLIKFGNVQRGYLGIKLDELNGTKAEEYNIKINEGVYVQGFTQSSAAKESGIKVGDVVVKVDGASIKSTPQFQEQIGRKRPGETVMLTVNREGVEKTIPVTLRNRDGGKDIIKKDAVAVNQDADMSGLGAQFANLNDRERKKLETFGYSNGVKIESLEAGKLARMGLEDGFIITKIDGKAIKSVQELKTTLASSKGGRVQAEGVYLDTGEVISFPLGL